MPSTSSLTAEEKNKVKNAIPRPTNKVFFAALGRIYYAYPQPEKWAYAGLQGALAFSINNKDNTYHFTMVDLDGTRGVIWDHELYEGLEFNQDRAFFLSFAGDVSIKSCVIPCLSFNILLAIHGWFCFCR